MLPLEVLSGRRQLGRKLVDQAEEHFGVLAAEPARPAQGHRLTGMEVEWERRGHSPVTAESRGTFKEVRTTHDEEYLYLRLQLDQPLARPH